MGNTPFIPTVSQESRDEASEFLEQIAKNKPATAQDMLDEINKLNPNVAFAFINIFVLTYKFNLAIESFKNDKIKIINALTLKALSAFSYEDRLKIILTTPDLPINIFYQQLQQKEFRDQFERDNQLAPFLTKDFMAQLENYIDQECKDPNLSAELKNVCKKVKAYPLTDELITKELIRVYGFEEPLSNEQQDIIAIVKFFSNKELVDSQLKKLESMLIEKAKAANQYNSETQQLKGYEEGKPYDHNKLLSGFLKEFAKEHGFSGYAVFKGVISDPLFFRLLSNAILFKDQPFQGEKHGPFAHFIQWLLITLWYLEGKSGLHTSPADLLKWIGKNKENYWEPTFEIFPFKSLFKRSAMLVGVEKINEYLLNENCPFKITHQLIAGRHAKGYYRKDETDNYTLESFDNKTEEQLPPENKKNKI